MIRTIPASVVDAGRVAVGAALKGAPKPATPIKIVDSGKVRLGGMAPSLKA